MPFNYAKISYSIAEGMIKYS